MSSQSILAYLAPKWTSQRENVVTDALAYLIDKDRYRDVFDAFRKYVSLTGVHLPDSLILKPQASWLDASRPDMVGFDGKDRILIVESKFDAPLTPNQPVAYIKQLAMDKPAILLFIAPHDQWLKLWPVLVDRCGRQDAPSGGQAEPPSSFRVLNLDASRHLLALTSWESLFDALTVQMADGSAALRDILQLQSLCMGRKWDKPEPEKLIDELVTRLVDLGIADTRGYKATRQGTKYYRRYMTINGLKNWCVEYNEEVLDWCQSTTHLWLVKCPAKADPPHASELLKKLTIEHTMQGKNLYIPLSIPDESTAIDTVVLPSLLQQIADVKVQIC
jgi:hypothetical protein